MVRKVASVFIVGLGILGACIHFTDKKFQHSDLVQLSTPAITSSTPTPRSLVTTSTVVRSTNTPIVSPGSTPIIAPTNTPHPNSVDMGLWF